MGRGQNFKLNSHDVIFKGLGQKDSNKHESYREAEKFSQARKRKEAEKNAPTEIDSYGNRFWKNSAGELHREGDSPAVEYADGTRAWYQQGKCHRDGDLPAWEAANGTRQWFTHGKRHRDGDLPAVKGADGTREWWEQGEFIRKEKPERG